MSFHDRGAHLLWRCFQVMDVLGVCSHCQKSSSHPSVQQGCSTTCIIGVRIGKERGRFKIVNRCQWYSCYWDELGVKGSLWAVGALTAAVYSSTDPLTQVLLAGPLFGLYLDGAFLVKLTAAQLKTSWPCRVSLFGIVSSLRSSQLLSLRYSGVVVVKEKLGSGVRKLRWYVKEILLREQLDHMRDLSCTVTSIILKICTKFLLCQKNLVSVLYCMLQMTFSSLTTKMLNQCP